MIRLPIYRTGRLVAVKAVSTGAGIMVARSIASLLEDRVTLEIECIDRMYLNAYVPQLQYEGGFVGFVKRQLGLPIASTVAVAPLSRRFVAAIEAFVDENELDLVRFKKGERKDDVAQEYLREFEGEEGVLFVGKAQEKVSVFRTQKRWNPESGKSYPWITRGTALPNQYYIYLVDRDFGPMFIKFSSYFPYTARVCLNGNEWLKRQLTKRGISFEALDNGLLSCENPKAAQRIADQLDEKKIEAVFRKWLARLPHPFRAKDRRAGYRYQLSILQAEFSLTQVFDRPLTGRAFFEEVIRENLDLGRPDKVQLIFDRRVIKTTPGSFRTRVLTDGVTPSLHVQYKNSKIKQYFKLMRALRTETTINNTRDFGIGKLLGNLPALREIGFQANRRLLDVQSLSHDCQLGQESFANLHQPVVEDEQRVPALRFGDPRVMAMLQALTSFQLLTRGFRNRDLREFIAPLLGLRVDEFSQGRMTYDLRRLRLRGLLERIPRTHRYRVTAEGFRVAFHYTRVHARVLAPVLASPGPSALDQSSVPRRSRTALHRLEHAMESFIARTEGLAA